ncbi:hypothetical protein DFH06DRAFT_1447935 [Mycena polygramma]|nr:hypothetical protein DFH06DRAFT_1447935 [Mycena polygramma]
MASEPAPQLRARIDELSSLIELQKQVLRDLEKKRSQVQRDLNAIVDPMSRLPLEISSDIFIRCLPDSPRCHAGTAPMVFLNTCHLWSTIALSTPALWTTIHSDCPNTAHLGAWLDRARTLPLSLSLHGSFSPAVSTMVKHHARQVHRLELTVGPPEQLQQLITQFPTLTKLRITSRIGLYTVSFLREILDVLRCAPSLHECDLVGMYGRQDVDSDPFTLACLRHLRLGEVADETDSRGGMDNSAFVLRHLTLPALETLSIGDLDIFADEFDDFLTRSSPPLQSLHVGTNTEGIADAILDRVPSLTELSLDFGGPEPDQPGIFETMTIAGPDFLPNLRKLTISGWIPDQADNSVLMDALTPRRTKTAFTQNHFPVQRFSGARRDANPPWPPRSQLSLSITSANVLSLPANRFINTQLRLVTEGRCQNDLHLLEKLGKVQHRYLVHRAVRHGPENQSTTRDSSGATAYLSKDSWNIER